MSVKQIESHDLVTDPAQAPAPESTTPRRRQLGRYALGVLILAGGLGGAALLAPAAAPPMLTDADLKYLQDAEHFGGFVLGNRTLPLLAGALKDGDAEAVKSFLADSFQGHLFAEDAGELTTYAFATFRRFDEDDGAAEPLDRDGFVETLLAYRAEFDERANVSLKVMQMQPVTYGELEGPAATATPLRSLVDVEDEVVGALGVHVDPQPRLRRVDQVGRQSPRLGLGLLLTRHPVHRGGIGLAGPGSRRRRTGVDVQE